ncbi:hypothetical protein [Jiella sonneratiae]|uniref:Uncharacterized protein n=1 Tax=Jiella sonneratiae TaxID=2816856 RepID=A0ABS3J7X7_9HYPH|nr:hypothetical protein [Jiella sonneratiae]MBO0905769.1 hypothetical protein [Jiella sonneratiae]
MANLRRDLKLAMAASAVLITAVGAFAQGQGQGQGQPKAAATGGIDLESSPFAPPKPGQSQDPSSGLTPRGLTLGELDWAPIASRCTFVRAGGGNGDAADAGKTEPGKGFGRFVFVTMVADSAGEGQPLERGYVMANGLVRELERGKTSAGKEKSVVTNWRAAGEPRISVGLILTGTAKLNDQTQYTGTMTVFWGDKKEEVPVRGSCG